MARKTPVEKLNEAIGKILEDYGEDIKDNVAQIATEMGKKGAQALRAKSREVFPVNKSHEITGEYAKGWAYRAERGRLATKVTIYNEHPALPHLLEYGHVTRNGTGRTYAPTPAHEHIQPVADELIETFEREVASQL